MLCTGALFILVDIKQTNGIINSLTISRISNIKKLKLNSIQKGFTIVELIVVIAIIGVLASISVISFIGISKRASISSLQSDLVNASSQLKIFQIHNDSFPTAINCPTSDPSEICVNFSPGNIIESYDFNNTPGQQDFNLKIKNPTSDLIYEITNTTTPSLYVLVPPQTFTYTGNYQTYTVPSSVSSLTIEAWGAQGGQGGYGGYAKGTISVIPGDILRVYVGGQGFFNDYCNKAVNKGAGFNGGGGANCYGMGGGGASDVRKSPYGLVDRLLVGGGGGGRGVEGASGGGGGGLVGISGSGGTVPNGTGGTQSAGGTVSTGSGNGSLGQGGYQTLYHAWGGSGGGGGGYYGGAAGGDPVGGNGGGGGGGSSYVQPTASSVSYLSAVRTGNGQIIVTPQ